VRERFARPPERSGPGAAWVQGRGFYPDTRIGLFPIAPCPGRTDDGTDTFLPSLPAREESDIREDPETLLHYLPFSFSLLLRLIDIIKSLYELINRELRVPARRMDGAPQNENTNQIARRQSHRALKSGDNEFQSSFYELIKKNCQSNYIYAMDKFYL
jgi:hypothetical protein